MILLTNGYRGRPSNEQFIAPGTYANDDPSLFGLGSYLIENGFAYALEYGVPTNEGGVDPESTAAVEQISLPNLDFVQNEINVEQTSVSVEQVEDEGDKLAGRRQSGRNRRD